MKLIRFYNKTISVKDLLFVLCAVIPTFNNYELTFATWTLTLLFTIRKNYNTYLFKLVLSTLIILIIAFFTTSYYDASNFKIIRDITYLLKPTFGLLVGYQLFNNDYEKTIRLIIKVGLILAILHFIILFTGVVVFKIHNIHALRYRGGYFSDFEVYSFVLLLFYKKFNINYNSKDRLKHLYIIGISVFFYFARTNFIQLFIFIITLMGLLKLNYKALKIVSTLILISALCYAAIYYYNPRRGAGGIEAFMYKVKIAPVEPFKTKINQDDWKDFNDNYRSFENIITVRQVSGTGTAEVLFGKGLGSEIDLGRKIYTNDDEQIRFLPALHNSYMTVFLKSGLLGVMLMLYFLFILFKYSKTHDEQSNINILNRLLMATGLFLIMSNWIFMGLYFKVDNKALIIGVIIAAKEFLIKKENLINN